MLLQPLNVLAFTGKNRMMEFVKYVIKKLGKDRWKEGLDLEYDLRHPEDRGTAISLD